MPEMTETPTERRLRKVFETDTWDAQQMDSDQLRADAAAIDKGRQAIALLRKLRNAPYVVMVDWAQGQIDALLTACQEDEG